MTAPQPLTLHAALLRAFHTASVTGEPHQRLVEDSQKAADIAARVVGPFIDEARTAARKECVMFLRGWSASARQRGELIAANTAAWLANEIDPLGPVMGAPASGGTT